MSVFLPIRDFGLGTVFTIVAAGPNRRLVISSGVRWQLTIYLDRGAGRLPGLEDGRHVGMGTVLGVAGKRFGVGHAAAVAERPRTAVAVADRNGAIRHAIRTARQAEVGPGVGSEGAGRGARTVLAARQPARVVSDRDLRRVAVGCAHHRGKGHAVRIAGALARSQHGFGTQVKRSRPEILELTGADLILNHIHDLEILGGQTATVGHTDLTIDVAFVRGCGLGDGDGILRAARFEGACGQDGGRHRFGDAPTKRLPRVAGRRFVSCQRGAGLLSRYRHVPHDCQRQNGHQYHP